MRPFRNASSTPFVGAIARDRDISPHVVVLAWVLGLSPNVIVIPGARSAKNAVDSATAADVQLTADERSAIDDAQFSIA